MSQYALLLRSEEIDFGAYSQSDYEKLLADFAVWNQDLERKSLYASAGLSGSDARTARIRDGRSVIDGPYCETKEAVTGICIVEAENIEHALELAAGCPFIPRGGSVEVRGISQLEVSKLFKEERHGEVCE